jgi:hypothetical protein
MWHFRVLHYLTNSRHQIHLRNRLEPLGPERAKAGIGHRCDGKDRSSNPKHETMSKAAKHDNKKFLWKLTHSVHQSTL